MQTEKHLLPGVNITTYSRLFSAFLRMTFDICIYFFALILLLLGASQTTFYRLLGHPTRRFSFTFLLHRHIFPKRRLSAPTDPSHVIPSQACSVHHFPITILFIQPMSCHFRFSAFLLFVSPFRDEFLPSLEGTCHFISRCQEKVAGGFINFLST